MEKSTKIPLFRRCVIQNFPFIEEDFDALTDYGLLCKVVEYLNKVINQTNINSEQVEALSTSFNQLKEYVDHYFDNLDIQEEINNKLDEMAEAGTLATILDKLPLTDLNFRNDIRISISETDLYEGASHAFMQGFCKVGNNYVIAFRNQANADNYIRLVEVNATTGQTIRQTYLTLNHANSLSYNSTLNCIYVASCAKIVDSVYTYDDDIFVVDYQSLTITKTIQVSNIPSGHRIRSVYYDNTDGILYGGDEHDMFVINEETETITETIELETNGLDLTATNQTFKKIGNYYIGTFISFIAYWDLSKKLVKINNINQIQDGEYIGEVEDTYFGANGEVIIGCANNDSPRIAKRNASFFSSNVTVNNSQLARVPGATTTTMSIYVDANSVNAKEDGTSTYPFKSLQRAINYAMVFNRNKEIVINAGSYDYAYIHGVDELDVVINGNVTIDGLEINHSNVVIYKNNPEYTTTINGVSVRYGSLKTEDAITINKFTKTGVLGADYNLYTYFAHVDINRATFDGDDTHSLVCATYNSILSLRECVFTDYAGNYAVEAKQNSIVTTYDLSLDQEVSATEHNFLIQTGARVFTRGALYDKDNFVIETQGMKYPTEAIITPEHTFYGTLCTVDDHYNHVLFRVKLAGANSDHINVLAKISDLNSYVIDTTALVSTGITFGKLELKLTDAGVLSINKSSANFFKFADGTNDYSTNSTDTPDNTQRWCKIEKITYLSL